MINLSILSHVGVIEIDRAHKKNALTHAMWELLAQRVGEAQLENDVRLIILRGKGDDFCAGADIGEFDALRDNHQRAQEYEAANTDAFAAIRNCPVPTIAAINGVCFGGGFGIAAACDLRFSTPDARFCIPAAKLGLAYPVEAMADIVHAVGAQRAKQLLFTAEIFNAQSALQYGFLSSVFDDENFDAEIEKLSQTICTNAPLSNIASKQAIIAALSNDTKDIAKAIALGQSTFESADYGEGRVAFKQKRKPIFKGN